MVYAYGKSQFSLKLLLANVYMTSCIFSFSPQIFRCPIFYLWDPLWLWLLFCFPALIGHTWSLLQEAPWSCEWHCGRDQLRVHCMLSFHADEIWKKNRNGTYVSSAQCFLVHSNFPLSDLQATSAISSRC